MKFLSVRDFKGKSAQIWKELPEEREMVLTSNGRPIAILSSVNESNLEKVLSAFRRSRAIEATATLQYESTVKGTSNLTMEDIEKEIKLVRKQRKK